MKAPRAAAPAQAGAAGGAIARTLNCFYDDLKHKVSSFQPGQVGLVDGGRSEDYLKPINLLRLCARLSYARLA